MMATNLGRYIITEPATSREFRELLREAIDDGSRVIRITMSGVDDETTSQDEFRLIQSRYSQLSVEYIGKLSDHGTATVIAMTHTDFSDAPAQLTITRRATP